MKINFEEMYNDAKMRMIIEKCIGGSKNSRLNDTDIDEMNRFLNLPGKNSIQNFYIQMPTHDSSKNSAQKAFVDLVADLCQNNSYFKKLQDNQWFFSIQELSSISNLSKRYGEVKEGYYVFKDAEVTLLMVRAVKVVLEAIGEKELNRYVFKFDVKELDYGWYPTLEEYDPGLSTQEWLDILSMPGMLTDKTAYALAAIYDIGGEASCTMLEENYPIGVQSFSATFSQFADKIKRKELCPAPPEVKNEKNWPILFQGRDTGDGESGSTIYRVRPELMAALKEFDITRFLDKDPSQNRIGKFYSWEILDEETALKHCDKSFFEYNDSGVPKAICWFFDAEELETGAKIPITLIYDGVAYNAEIANDSPERDSKHISWRKNGLGQIFNNLRKDGMTVTFHKEDEGVYTITVQGGEEEVEKPYSYTTAETIKHIKQYIAGQGYTYPDGLIENFFLCLKSKPFTILAGTSGTGKTNLVEVFAEAIDAKYELVPVRPDWSDSTDLFGHMNLNGKFVPGACIDTILEAQQNPNKPYILCMDEMNLARVEYYFSDFLSIMESRKIKDGAYTCKPLLTADKYGEDAEAFAKYGELIFPQNLYIVGTVNMDETTFPFSKKVLDRANTIEFNYVNLMPAKVKADAVAPLKNVPNRILQTEYYKLVDIVDEDAVVTETCAELQALNEILQAANLHVGYRVRDEICFYMVNNKKTDLLGFTEAMDNEILQKILPRIQGSSESVQAMMKNLLTFCQGKYPKCVEKLQMMLKRYDEDGFTTYWV